MKQTVSLISILLLLTGQTGYGKNTTEEQSYQYRFSNHPKVTYRVTEKCQSLATICREKRSTQLSYEHVVSFRLSLRLLSSTKNKSIMEVSCEDINAIWNLKFGTNTVSLSQLQDGTIKGTMDSAPVKIRDYSAIRKETASLFMRGNIEIDPSGAVTILSDDEDFIEYWGRWERICPLKFPPQQISVGDNWTLVRGHRNMNMLVDNQLEGILSERDFMEEVTTEYKPPITINNSKCLVFSLASQSVTPSQHEVSLKSGTVSVPKCTSTGTVIFDNSAGLVVNSSTKHDFEMNALKTVGEKQANLILTMTRSIEMTLQKN